MLQDSSEYLKYESKINLHIILNMWPLIDTSFIILNKHFHTM